MRTGPVTTRTRAVRGSTTTATAGNVGVTSGTSAQLVGDVTSGIDTTVTAGTTAAIEQNVASARRLHFWRLPDGSVEIGWRLATRFWGKGYVTEAAGRLLEYGRHTLGHPVIHAFAVHDNHRSIAVMRRLGMQHLQGEDFDHPKVPDSHPQLKRHVLFRTSDDIRETQTTRHD